MRDTYDADPTSEGPERKLARIAERQHGVFTRTQAIGCGFAPRSIDRRALSGTWDRLYTGVYRLAGSPNTWRQSLMAACLASGGVVSHRAAAVLWQLPRVSADRIDVSLRAGRRRARDHSIHRPRSLDDVDITQIDGIPVTTPARTLIDLAGLLSTANLEEVLDDALRRKIVRVTTLRNRLARLGTRGRDGSASLARLLDERSRSAAVPQSVFETRLLRLLRAHGLPKPTIQHPVEIGKEVAILDFAYIDRKVALEADGFRWHSSRRQWDHDRVRRTKLTRLGWIVVHITWSQLRGHPDEVVDDIREILKTRPGSDALL